MKVPLIVPICDIVGLLGCALVSFGVGMIYIPAGVIAAGILLMLLALFGFAPDSNKKVGD
jgi:hypothetical protein